MAGEPWQLEGTVVIACNCDYGCPCNFNALPTQGHCEGGWAWHVERGRYGDTSLDGLAFGVYVQWPGAIHEGDGRAIVLYDERADDAQSAAIQALVGGDVGGPWGVLAWTWTTIDGPRPVPWEAELSGVDTRLKAGDYVEVRSEPIRNPVSGAEVHPGAVLPEGIILKRADFGSSAAFRVANGVRYEHEGRYTAVGRFEYAGPPEEG